ncbi:MAG: 6-phosphogluconolactonase [Planctomycetota bacterium]|nr:6-phosphogluconolactonase [Planctomycetota bacterium]
MPNPPLRLPGEVHVAPDADLLYDDLASAMLGSAIDAIGKRGVFHVALSGGKTPEPFLIRLVTDPRFRHIPWQHAHLWLVDERRVPYADDRSNWKMIKETLADHVPMKARQLHPMPVEGNDPAGEYEQELRRVFAKPAYVAPPQPDELARKASPATPAPVKPAPAADPIPRLDFVLLGMGDDAHTASLFPGSPALAETQRLIVANEGPAVTPPPRVTMTYPLLNAARKLAVLVVGQKKNATLRRIDAQMKSGGPNPAAMPIMGVMPTDGKLTWYLDAPASGREPEE